MDNKKEIIFWMNFSYPHPQTLRFVLTVGSYNHLSSFFLTVGFQSKAINWRVKINHIICKGMKKIITNTEAKTQGGVDRGSDAQGSRVYKKVAKNMHFV